MPPYTPAALSHEICQAILVIVRQESSWHTASGFPVTSIEASFKLSPLIECEFVIFAFIVDTVALVCVVLSPAVVVLEIVSEKVDALCFLCIFVQVIYVADDVIIIKHVCVVILR